MKLVLRSVALASAGALALTGCGAQNSASDSKDDVVKVVTTTDVYADVVRQIAGDKVEVTSLISSTSQDPHSYEATASDRLKVKDADLVVLNGGGYDQFLEDMAGTDNPDQKVINAVEESGLFSEEEIKELTEGHQHSEVEEHTHNHGSLNEHVWYSLDAMKKVSEAVATELKAVDSTDADTFAKNSESFEAKLDTLKKDAESLNAKGKHFIATEPVPNYLLQTTGMEDVTPADFTAAIEDGSDVAPLTLQEIKDQLANGSVNFLGYNEQTSSNQTNEVLKTAQEHHVANASFYETLPEGKSYVDWMNDNISNIKQAVDQ